MRSLTKVAITGTVASMVMLGCVMGVAPGVLAPKKTPVTFRNDGSTDVVIYEVSDGPRYVMKLPRMGTEVKNVVIGGDDVLRFTLSRSRSGISRHREQMGSEIIYTTNNIPIGEGDFIRVIIGDDLAGTVVIHSSRKPD